MESFFSLPNSPQKSPQTQPNYVLEELPSTTLHFSSENELITEDSIYVHLFHSDERSLVYAYYVSSAPYETDDLLISCNLRYKGTKTNAQSFILFDPITKEVYKKQVYDLSQLESTIKSSPERFKVEYVFVYLLEQSIENMRQPMGIYEKEDCAICLEHCSQPLYTCGHWVHTECISLCKHKRCPLCKKECNLPSLLYIHPSLRSLASSFFQRITRVSAKEIAYGIQTYSLKTQEAILTKYLTRWQQKHLQSTVK